MKPKRIELEGFTAYRKRTVIDFEDTDLFVIVGPTGSGKSSLIDAMIFALYGSVPRFDDQKLVQPVISQGKIEARVLLSFRARWKGLLGHPHRTAFGIGPEQGFDQGSAPRIGRGSDCLGCARGHRGRCRPHRPHLRSVHEMRRPSTGSVRALSPRQAEGAAGTAESASRVGALRATRCASTRGSRYRQGQGGDFPGADRRSCSLHGRPGATGGGVLEVGRCSRGPVQNGAGVDRGNGARVQRPPSLC